MATDPRPFEDTLDIREQIARIDKMQAELARIQQEIKIVPFTLIFSGVGAGAALFVAGAAFTKLFIG